MRIHGSGGFPHGGSQANWKQGNQDKSDPAKAAQRGGDSWGNRKDKGQGDQFQRSFDLSQHADHDRHGSWGRQNGDHDFGGWKHHGHGTNPFKTDSTQTPTQSSGSNGSGSDDTNPFKIDPTQPPTPPSGSSDSGDDGTTTKPSPTPSSGPSNPPANGSTGDLFSGGKEGLGVSDTSSNGDGSNLGNTNASWYYNWSPNASGTVNDPNAKFIPMIWGGKNMNPQDLQAAANSDSPMLLTFNEPELPSQANMTPDEALSHWDQLEATGKKLSSPAVSNGPEGMKWLDEFMQKASASGRRVDSIALHWYGNSATPTEQNVASLKDHIEQVHNKYPNLPINLTEFGVDASGLTAGQDQDFLTAAEKMLNDLPYVQMYSPYGLGSINGN